MITLYQHPVSPFCITIEAILKYAKGEYRIINIPLASDRKIVVEKSKGASCKIPLLEDNNSVVWDNTDFGQEIPRYLDGKFKTGLFPPELEGLQAILARYIENDVESVGFKLNDIYYESWLHDPYDRMMWLRHKERKFGPGCISLWTRQKEELQIALDTLLTPFDQILSRQSFLTGETLRFVDFDLFGILGNYLFSGHHTLSPQLSHLQRWYQKMKLDLQMGKKARVLLRSPREALGGYVFLPRLIDKIRLHAEGKLSPEYLGNLLKPGLTFDGRLLSFLELDGEALRGAILSARTDNEVLAWVEKNGKSSTAGEKKKWIEEIEAFRPDPPYVERRKQTYPDLAVKIDLARVNIFDMVDMDEGCLSIPDRRP